NQTGRATDDNSIDSNSTQRLETTPAARGLSVFDALQATLKGRSHVAGGVHGRAGLTLRDARFDDGRGRCGRSRWDQGTYVMASRLFSVPSTTYRVVPAYASPSGVFRLAGRWPGATAALLAAPAIVGTN